MKRRHGLVQFGPKFGVQAEVSWNWYGLNLGITLFCRCSMTGFVLNLLWLHIIVFREQYEPYTRYHMVSPNTPFSLEAA